VICATNRDLRSEVNAGRFRQDLYYRIAVVLLNIPPLRERIGDVPVLVEHFLREAGHDGPVEAVVPTTVMQALRAHHWPGNVRELKNFVDAALAMGETPVLEPLPANVPAPGTGTPEAAGQGAATGSAEPSEAVGRFFLKTPLEQLFQLSYKDARGALLNEFEILYLADLMEKTRHNVSKAARDAQMNRSYLIEMLKRHNIR
jgi:DNA-binding NtrC family response regulator